MPAASPVHSLTQSCTSRGRSPDPASRSSPAGQSHRSLPRATVSSPPMRLPEKCRSLHPEETRSTFHTIPSTRLLQRHPKSPKPRIRNLPECVRSALSWFGLAPVPRYLLQTQDSPHSLRSSPPPPRARIPGSSPQSTCSTAEHTADRNPAKLNSQSHTAPRLRAIPRAPLHSRRSVVRSEQEPVKCVSHRCRRCRIACWPRSPIHKCKI